MILQDSIYDRRSTYGIRENDYNIQEFEREYKTRTGQICRPKKVTPAAGSSVRETSPVIVKRRKLDIPAGLPVHGTDCEPIGDSQLPEVDSSGNVISGGNEGNGQPSQATLKKFMVLVMLVLHL